LIGNAIEACADIGGMAVTTAAIFAATVGLVVAWFM
jgi:hypothetical protein